jgi:hypothetical protein
MCPPPIWAEEIAPANPFFIDTPSDDPLLRAANMDLYTKDQEGKLFKGKGGLLRLGQNLGILTVNHVIRDRQKLIYQIPGHPRFRMEDPVLRATQMRAGSIDKAVFIPLPRDYSNVLEELARADLITPLRLAATLPEMGKLVAQPNATYGFDLFEIKGFNPAVNEIRVESPAYVPICRGKSGTPMLTVLDNHAIPEVAGLVKNFPVAFRLNEDTESPEYICSLKQNLANVLGV